MIKHIKRLKAQIIENRNLEWELVWARTWDDTKKDIEWIQHLPGISPGRWAVGYNYMYVMTRILNEFSPEKVLDLGLGISSSLISTYFGFSGKKGTHDIIEQDSGWATFYVKTHGLSDSSHIHIVNSVKKEYKGSIYNAYENISDIVCNKKYNVISIDAPKGSTDYSRRDVLPFLPEILSEDFVILMDDSERKGEQATIVEIKDILEKNGIEYCYGEFLGYSKLSIITSASYKYICTM